MQKASPLIIGIDEAGRGPWARPVVAACVLLSDKVDLKLLRDSKQLTPVRRESAYAAIHKHCPYGIGIVDNQRIDQIGIKKATNQAMCEALDCLLQQLPQKTRKTNIQLLVDGNDKFTFPFPHESIVKGDQKVPAISAASLVAKVWRDKLMDLYHEAYPVYSFHEHKGYGTRKHSHALAKHGLCPIHRRSYQPVKKMMLSPSRPKHAYNKHTLFD